MHTELTKTQVLADLAAEHGRWEALLAEVGAARMTGSILREKWSVKDIVAHITWEEQQTVDLLQPPGRRPLTRDWLWDLTPDKRNAILFRESRDRALPDVLAQAEQVYSQLVAAVQALTEEEVRDPQRFPNMPPTWQPWHLIADHSYAHYRHHTPTIRAWLATLAPPAAVPVA